MPQIVQSQFRLHIGWYIAAAILATVVFAIQPWWTVDDAFISYRYAKNLVSHGQLTWNIGEQPFVEGYTGIFLPLLASLILSIGLPLLATIKVLGILAFLGCVVLFINFAQALKIKPRQQLLGLAAILISPLFYMHSISGLETIFFSLFLFGSFRALHSTDSKNWGVKLGLWLILLAACRPEGYLMVALTSILVLVYHKNLYSFKINILYYSIIAIIPAIFLLIWRNYYYGEWLPNTFYAKQYHGLFAQDSIKAFLQFFVYYLLIPLGLGILSTLNRASSKADQTPSKLVFTVGLAFITILLLVYFRSNLYMNYGSRFFVPIYLPILLFALHALNNGRSPKSETPSPRAKQLVTVFIAMCIVCQSLLIAWRFEREWYFLDYYSAIMEDELQPMAKYVRENIPPNARIVSYMDAGALGYYSDLEIVDFGKLNSLYLAHTDLSQSEVIDYFFSLKAEAVIFTSETEKGYQYIPEAEEIVRDPRFNTYQKVKQWSNRLKYPYYQRLYIRQH